MRIGYLISRYPAVSHTFIQREVLGLRKLGWAVTTISVRRAAAKDLLTAADQNEASSTHVLVPPNPFLLIAAVAKPLFWRPGVFLRAASTAWGLRRAGLRGTLWAFFYFLEALLVHRLSVHNQLRHLHAHFANVSSDVAMIAAVLNGGSFSFTMHGPTEFFDLREHKLAEKAAAAAFVVCISDFARSQLMSLLPPEQWGKLEVVHCGVDPQQFQTARSPRRAGDLSPHRLLCVARLAPVKAHVILFQAVAELLIRGHNVALTVAGDGPLRRVLERQADTLGIADRVDFLGSVGQDVIHEHYARADAFVLPSFAEGVPVVLMEAMAARCPVVATHIAGIPELIEQNVTGVLVPPGRADLLADAVERLLVNPRAAERMAEAAAEKIRRDFNLNKVAPQLAAIFRQRLDPRPVPLVQGPVHRRRGIDPAAAEAALAARPAARGTGPVLEPTDTPRGAA
jgi:glycosyltransferase involved in cell wall biosynthesis